MPWHRRGQERKMSRNSFVELTNLCVLCDGSRVLVQDKTGCGIVFPGGHVEAGESLLASVVREMREETGLTVENPMLCGVKDWMCEDGTRYLVALYRAEKFSGTLHSSGEGRVFWMERAEFEKMDVIWGMHEVLKICDSAEYSEMFYSEEKGSWELIG